MRRRSAGIGIGVVLLALSACSGSGSSRVADDDPLPSLTTAASSPAATDSPPRSAAPRRSHRPSPTATAARATSTATRTRSSAPSPRTTTRPPATHSPTPKPTSKSPAAKPCAGVQGSTTTIKETAGYKFAPAAVSIHRCDRVRALYADTTGAPHTWTGRGWDSGNMTASSNSSYTYQFTSTGRFDFFCSYHKSVGMTGTVTVS